MRHALLTRGPPAPTNQEPGVCGVVRIVLDTSVGICIPVQVGIVGRIDLFKRTLKYLGGPNIDIDRHHRRLVWVIVIDPDRHLRRALGHRLDLDGRFGPDN